MYKRDYEFHICVIIRIRLFCYVCKMWVNFYLLCIFESQLAFDWEKLLSFNELLMQYIFPICDNETWIIYVLFLFKWNSMPNIATLFAYAYMINSDVMGP